MSTIIKIGEREREREREREQQNVAKSSSLPFLLTRGGARRHEMLLMAPIFLNRMTARAQTCCLLSRVLVLFVLVIVSVSCSWACPPTVISNFTVAKFGSSKLTISDCTEHFSFGANTSTAVKSSIFSSIINGGLANTALSMRAIEPCQLPAQLITDAIIPGATMPGNSTYVSGTPFSNLLCKIFASFVRLVSNRNRPDFEHTKHDANGSYASCKDLFGFDRSIFASPSRTAGCDSELHGLMMLYSAPPFKFVGFFVCCAINSIHFWSFVLYSLFSL